jgi:hypothetical protein
MSSIREQIIEAVVPLVTVTGVAQVYRSRQAAIQRAEGNVVVVQPKEEEVTIQATGTARRDLMLEILLIIRSDTPDQTADPMAVAMHAGILAASLNGSTPLGSLVDRVVEEGTTWEMAEADVTALEVSLKYRFRYMTPWTALDALA